MLRNLRDRRREVWRTLDPMRCVSCEEVYQEPCGFNNGGVTVEQEEAFMSDKKEKTSWVGRFRLGMAALEGTIREGRGYCPKCRRSGNLEGYIP